MNRMPNKGVYDKKKLPPTHNHHDDTHAMHYQPKLSYIFFSYFSFTMLINGFSTK